jgi:hypothetical protein
LIVVSIPRTRMGCLGDALTTQSSLLLVRARGQDEANI